MRYLLKITTTFALALVFTAGMAFGQSPGDDNEATVNQNGNSEAVVNQNATVSNASNDAFVDQAGDGLVAKITQMDNGGSQGLGTSGNEVDLRQTETGNGVSEAYIVQKGETARPGSQVFLKQFGNVRADITQTDENTVEGFYGGFAEQRGNNNQLTVIQDPGNDGLVGVDQRGTSHTMRVETEDGNNHEAQMKQRGNDQTAKVSQRGGRTFVEVQQFNDGNETYIDQGDSGGGPDGTEESSAWVYQDGISNRTDIIQRGGFNSADVTQTGNGGIVEISQSGNESTTIP